MSNGKDGGYGPGWADVASCIRAFQRKWGGNWTCRVFSAPRLGRPDCLRVVCSRRYGRSEGGVEREQYVGAEYPSVQRDSMPAIMHELLYQLDKQLEADKVVAEQQTSF